MKLHKISQPAVAHQRLFRPRRLRRQRRQPAVCRIVALIQRRPLQQRPRRHLRLAAAAVIRHRHQFRQLPRQQTRLQLPNHISNRRLQAQTRHPVHLQHLLRQRHPRISTRPPLIIQAPRRLIHIQPQLHPAPHRHIRHRGQTHRLRRRQQCRCLLFLNGRLNLGGQAGHQIFFQFAAPGLATGFLVWPRLFFCSFFDGLA